MDEKTRADVIKYPIRKTVTVLIDNYPTIYSAVQVSVLLIKVITKLMGISFPRVCYSRLDAKIAIGRSIGFQG